MLEKVRIVLVETTHPGNIGATARAMKNMGLSRLYLVNPKLFPNVEATARAAGADDILAAAEVTENLDEALSDCSLVMGTSARLRELPLELLTPRECGERANSVAGYGEVAVVFGRESSGLNNEELQRCHCHIHIPTVQKFSSLNLAAAVQIVVYELYLAGLDEVQRKVEREPLATADEMEMFYKHLYQTLIDIKFLDNNRSKKIMLRLRRLFNRCQVETTEMNILRGILANAQKRD